MVLFFGANRAPGGIQSELGKRNLWSGENQVLQAGFTPRSAHGERGFRVRTCLTPGHVGDIPGDLTIIQFV